MAAVVLSQGHPFPEMTHGFWFFFSVSAVDVLVDLLVDSFFPGRFPWKNEQEKNPPKTKSLLMPLFLMGCFPGDFRDGKRPISTKSGKRPIKVCKRPIKEVKRPVKAMVLVGISVGCLMGCFRAPQPWRKTAPLKRPIKGSMRKVHKKSTIFKGPF